MATNKIKAHCQFKYDDWFTSSSGLTVHMHHLVVCIIVTESILWFDNMPFDSNKPYNLKRTKSETPLRLPTQLLLDTPMFHLIILLIFSILYERSTN